MLLGNTPSPKSKRERRKPGKAPTGRPRSGEERLPAAGSQAEAELFERVARGDSISAIVSDLGIARSSFYRFCSSTPKRAEMFAAAKAASADAHIEKAEQVLEDAAKDKELSSAHSQIAGARSRLHQWLAEKRAPAEYGSVPAQMIIQAGDLHFQALIQYGSVPVKRFGDTIQDAELLQDSEGIDVPLIGVSGA